MKELLIPTLRPGDIVVMDNLRIHHIQAVGELVHTAGAQILYLPAYSPDLNPILSELSYADRMQEKYKFNTGSISPKLSAF